MEKNNNVNYYIFYYRTSNNEYFSDLRVKELRNIYTDSFWLKKIPKDLKWFY